MLKPRIRRALVATAVALVPACGLIPGSPPEIRWFTALPPVATAPDEIPADAPDLRLRRVTAAAHLGERFAWRTGAEFGFSELVRWTEPPEEAVERALDAALFESGAFRRDGRAEHVLEVDVRAFEHDRGAGAAVVGLGVRVLAADDVARVERAVQVARPVPADAGPAEVAAAMRAALAEAALAARDLARASP